MRRDPANRMGPAQRIKLAAAIRARLEANPNATLGELAAATGASNNLVVQVRQRWQYERERRVSA